MDDGDFDARRAQAQANLSQAHINETLKNRAAQLMGELERLRGGLDELRRNLLAVSATVTSDDGFITATVGPRGQLQHLDIDPRIYRKPDARRLADTITATVQRAAEQAQLKVEAACRPFIPEDELRDHLGFDFGATVRRMDHQLGELGPRAG